MKALREKALLLVVGVIALYAAAVGLWFFRQEAEWRRAAKNYRKAVETFEAEEKLIAEKGKWTAAYQRERSLMTSFAEGESTVTYWMRKLDGLAETNNIVVERKQARGEVVAGEILEMPIEASGFETSLPSLVAFLYQLENSDEGMFDVAELSIKPVVTKKTFTGYLKGSFTLNCAYLRGEEAK